jgi:hypothetical protein
MFEIWTGHCNEGPKTSTKAKSTARMRIQGLRAGRYSSVLRPQGAAATLNNGILDVVLSREDWVIKH